MALSKWTRSRTNSIPNLKIISSTRALYRTTIPPQRIKCLAAPHCSPTSRARPSVISECETSLRRADFPWAPTTGKSTHNRTRTLQICISPHKLLGLNPAWWAVQSRTKCQNDQPPLATLTRKTTCFKTTDQISLKTPRISSSMCPDTGSIRRQRKFWIRLTITSRLKVTPNHSREANHSSTFQLQCSRCCSLI